MDSLGDSPITDDYLKAVKFDAVASVLRQCDKSKDERLDHNDSGIFAISSRFQPSTRYNRVKKTLKQHELAHLKMKTTCRKCGKKGH